MSGLRVYRSNHIELLAQLLARLVASSAPADPIASVSVVVGNRGMERWLRHRLAETIGVCANVEFPFPTSRLDGILDAVLGEEEGADPWEPDALAWALLELLPGLVEQSGFEFVRAYMERWDGPVDAKAYGLARQLADVFDGYVAYRPLRAIAWSAGDRMALPEGAEGLAWQAELWRGLHTHLGDRPHRAQRIQEALERLRDGGLPRGLEGPLRLFGISSLPPSWMPLLGALSKHVDVELFLLCPSNEYWAELVGPRVRRDPSAWRDRVRDTIPDGLHDPDQDEAHPLLVSMGRVARDFQIVLESQPDGYEDSRLDAFLDVEQAFPDPAASGRPRALHQIQSDLLAARVPVDADRTRLLDASDDSVQFHRCHGPTRQVEVLRDVLLGLFEDHHDLEPRDVLVVTPDIEAYAPLVTAVFSRGPSRRLVRGGEAVAGAEGWGPAGAPRIPFEVADLSVRRLNPVADALMRVLELVEGRFEASAVLDLLVLEPVRMRFGLSAEDVSTLAEWVGQSGIRWGRDATHRKDKGQPPDPQNTWLFGLRRLLLGVVLADDGRTLAGVDACGAETVVRPFDAMEGKETALLGQLVDFTNTRFALTDSLRSPRPVREWIPALTAVLERITDTPATASWLVRRVRETLEELGESATATGSSRAVALEAIRSALSGQFLVASRLTREQSGAAVFCAMQPMRSVPYRVICLLGMDEDALPRKSSGHAFDLTARLPRVGDRSPRDEDRYLVLEAMLAARTHLIVLYTGHDPHTNEDRPPCVPIAELRDLVDRSFSAVDLQEGPCSPSAFMTTDHPLQPFGARAFLPVHRDPTRPGALRPSSFDRRLRYGAEVLGRSQGEASPFFPEGVESVDAGPDEIALEELVRFFVAPTRYLLQRRLKLDLRERGEVVDDREPVELDHLERWKLRHALLDERLAGRPATEVREGMRAEGLLPLGFAGKATVDAEVGVIDAMLEASTIQGAGSLRAPDDPIAIDLRLGDARITGSLPNVYGSSLIDLRFARGEGTKSLARPWLSLLAWHAACPEAGRAVVVMGHTKAGSPQTTLLGYEAPEDPAAVLQDLVAIYRLGCRAPVPLLPGASWTLAWYLRRVTTDPSFFDSGLPEDEEELARITDAYDRACGAFWRGYRGGGDLDDPHVARVFEGTPPLTDETLLPVPLDLDFARLALRVWGPVIAGRSTSRTVKKWLSEGAR
jgi:exodeoxyribonuclease V gamma subunit